MNLLSPSQHMLRLAQARSDKRVHDGPEHDEALWQRRCIQCLPSQETLDAALAEATRHFATPSQSAFKDRDRALHPEGAAQSKSTAELDLKQLLKPEWESYPVGAVFLHMLIAHTLPFFAQPAAVDFGLLKEPRTLDLRPADPRDEIIDPTCPPLILYSLIHEWLQKLQREDRGFYQRTDGVIVRRALILGLYTNIVDDDDDTLSSAAGHQLLLLCDLPPATSTACAVARNTPERPFQRIKLTIVDNLEGSDYRWPVHQWIGHAFKLAQMGVWYCRPGAYDDDVEPKRDWLAWVRPPPPAYALYDSKEDDYECVAVLNRLYMSDTLATLCMATSLRAVLIASLMREPEAKLMRQEPRGEGRRFASLIALHMRRMRRFLLTDAARIWNPHEPHAVFADCNFRGHLSAAKGETATAIMPFACSTTLWAVPLRDVPRGMAAAGIRRWVFEQSRLPIHPLYFQPSLSRPLGLTYSAPQREVADTCITASRYH